jgi:hypothetical protein
MVTSGAAPLIVYAFRRVRRITSTAAFLTCYAGRARVHLASEAVHRTWPSDFLTRIKRERAPTGTVAREPVPDLESSKVGGTPFKGLIPRVVRRPARWSPTPDLGHSALGHTLASEPEGSRGEPGPAVKHAKKMV